MRHPSTSEGAIGDTDNHPDLPRFTVPIFRGKIRIVKTPQGPAPLSIRKKWIGVEIPTVQFESKPRPQYIVRQDDALRELAKKCPTTAAWWTKMGFPREDEDFAFRADEAKEIEEVFPRK